MNLAAAFHACAQARPEKTAVFWGETELSFATLQRQSWAVSRRLMEDFGVKRGDRVGLWLKNRPEFVPAFFGILGTDAAVVPINNFLKPAEVNFILNDAGVDVLITDAELAAHAAALQAARPTLKIFQIESAVSDHPPANARPDSARAESDLAVIIYTSGARADRKERCSRMAISSKMWRAAAWCSRRWKPTASPSCCRCSTVTC